MTAITIYTKNNCEPCTQAKREIAKFKAQYPGQIKVTEIKLGNTKPNLPGFVGTPYYQFKFPSGTQNVSGVLTAQQIKETALSNNSSLKSILIFLAILLLLLFLIALIAKS